MAKPVVQLPSIDAVTGISLEGVTVAVQYKHAGPAQFPRPEDVGPDTWYELQMSVQQSRQLHAHLSQMLASGKMPR
jgi:hypothetical protein